ncbi:MAG TPA: hypothetical protein VD970_09370 [Acetobacteraceae bacterium]|nr:hypothetical protein [Acetobacteraceae bacterium]
MLVARRAAPTTDADMPFPDPQPDPSVLPAFLRLCGTRAWKARLEDLERRARAGRLQGRATQARHALEIALARLMDPEALARASLAERRILGLAREAVSLASTLPSAQRNRLKDCILAGLTGEGTLIPFFHQLRTAARYRARGFRVEFAGLLDNAGHDLLIRRGSAEAEVICEIVSAEEGRPVHRGDWYALVDRINPDLQRWLASHPGRYLLKMMLPEGLSGGERLAELHARIMTMLEQQSRQRADGAAVLKLDPLMLAGAQASDGPGALQLRLREQFGPEAHLAVTGSASGGSVFVMAARAGRENEVAQAVARRLATAAERLDGRRPGILAVFLEELERGEWRALRDTLELEGAVRRFLTTAPARRVAAVSCASRMELFGMAPPDSAPEGELRFRNPSHPQGHNADLAPAVLSLA